MKTKYFTMIELLLTISIILVLLTIAIPVYGVARRAVTRQQAATRAMDLKNAIVSYQRDYQVIPLYDTIKGKVNSNGDIILTSDEYTLFIKILRNVADVKYNPRKIVYLDYIATEDTTQFKCPLVANYQELDNKETRYLVICNLKGNPIQLTPNAVPIYTEVLVIGFNPKDLDPSYNDMGDITWINPTSISSDEWEILKEKAVFSSEF